MATTINQFWTGDGAAQSSMPAMTPGKMYVAWEIDGADPAVVQSIGAVLKDLAFGLQTGKLTPDTLEAALNDAIPMLSPKAQVIAQDIPMVLPFLHKKLTLMDDFTLGMTALHIITAMQGKSN